ncbi:FG-nucleoporin ASM4 [Saccharomyces paradoxus]|uniref:FG-nucleoporin ASM4 n=1 Tax=Saccharomyces paradoxus TaxID=27291 RepID=A0A8B8UN20_SACPA|nr:Asm4 [Saccharomyces paradoxus]QHS72148.1 Asm4 [Saccharomyces paradoxus]
MFGVRSGDNNSGFTSLTSQAPQTTPMFQSQSQLQAQLQPQQQQQSSPFNGPFGASSSRFGTSLTNTVNINNNSSNISSNSINNNNVNNSVNNTNQHSQGNNPSWVSNPKKRFTPHTVIRRKTTKQNSSSDISQNDESSSLNTSMRNFSKQNQDFKHNERNKSAANNDINSLLSTFNDIPPTVTLQDWQREDEFGSIPSLTTQFVSDKYTAKKINRPAYDSKNTPNVFDKDSYVRIANIEDNHLDNNYNTAETNNNKAHETFSKSSSLSAIIVFGYPESISNELIEHFSHFGRIMEDFQVLRLGRGISPSSFRIFHNRDTNCDQNDPTANKSITLKGKDNETSNKKYPIFTGESWVKLTYNSPSSALRALQENGTIFHGALIGCIPYSRNAVEQLAGCKIDNIDDIGEFNVSMYQSSSTPSTSNTPSPPNVIVTDDALLREDVNSPASNVGIGAKISSPKLANSLNKRLDVIDGKLPFMQNTGPNSNIPTLLRSLESKMRQQEEKYRNNEPAGFIHKLNNWLFGWNDL